MIALAALLVAQAVAPLAPTDPACAYDKDAMLALDERAFDQTMTGGWRSLFNKGCERTAADLLRAYRLAHPGATLTYLFAWHEGQLRAQAGETAQAIALFEQSRKSAMDDRGFGWNLYVDGSIAFLRHDRRGLQRARDALAVLPKPPGFDNDMRVPDGKPIPVRWPMNLNVLDGFLRCFGKDYRTAYGATCSAPIYTFKAAP